MLPVNRVPEPADFNNNVRKPGNQWLRTHPDTKRPRPYWKAHLTDLAEGFHRLCGYAAMLDPTRGTVDHYLSCHSHPELAYEWSNYRFSCAMLNAIKKDADNKILDPYEVQPGWFKIILPSLQLVLTDQVPSSVRAKAEYTLKRLKLKDGEAVIRWRQSWYELYCTGHLDLPGLQEVAPLIAAAVREQLQTS